LQAEIHRRLTRSPVGANSDGVPLDTLDADSIAGDPEIRQHLVKAATEAGRNSLRLAQDPAPELYRKEDLTPLTQADLEADAIIGRYLRELSLGIPVISEEQPAPAQESVRQATCYFLIDPLDGTRGFLEGTGEFTVNIALIADSAPVLGIVYVPAEDTAYVGGPRLGSHRIRLSGQDTLRVSEAPSIPLEELPFPPDSSFSPSLAPSTNPPLLRVVASRHNLDNETLAWLELKRSELQVEIELIQAGSGAKFCRIAEGTAHCYPRFAPCMAWDVGAGQAIVTGAGGSVLDAQTGASLSFDPSDLRARPFVAWSPHAIRRQR